jgi:omega-6 fatty acid desaturase (delta-12 desaturase)
MHVIPKEEWSFYRAALESCSYLKVGPIMSWITGNIGYHHIHHINSMIPFYRLAEAMEAIPELQNAVVTTLRPHEILACLRLKLWDETQNKMVGYEPTQFC